jgi:ABC-type transport system involved in cytochrome c biogenesis ATPase subunit
LELIALKVNGWRRFATAQTLQTPGKLVAILGPNEAGKSSLLRAFSFLRTPGTAAASDVARGAARKNTKVVGYLALSADELKSCGLTRPTRVVLTKSADDNIPTYELQPEAPARDDAPRKALIKQIDRCLANRRFSDAISESAEERLHALATTLQGAGSDLNESQLAELDQAAETLQTEDIPSKPQYVAALPERLKALSQHEKAAAPSEVAGAYIKSHLPKILFFGEEERNLDQSYLLDDLLTEVPPALANLADVAGLNIKALTEAVDANDAAEIESIRASANAKLRIRFEEDWSQSGVCVTFSIKDRYLNIIIESEPTKFTNLAERSDGFRQFVALQSFTMRQRADRPILLIDEAETHLHYDAQADLIQMLYRQEVASKVIFTTHSAGCLPEDLGLGVRLVAPSGPLTSTIVNRFWGSPEPGFSPLLIGMGASTLAFFPTRKALFVEGEAEMILLPTLLRRALEVDVLGFQVVPGLSKANKSQLPLAASRANRVGYLVDGDAGGRALAKELRSNNVPENCIFSLDAKASASWEFEDLINDSVLVSAANQLIRKFSPGCEEIVCSPPKTKKFRSIAQSFEASTGKTLSKVDVAYEVLDLASRDPHRSLFDEGRIGAFSKLAATLKAYFKEA